MEHIDGIYAGDIIWGSSYRDGEFIDQRLTLEIANRGDGDYITSDNLSVAGNVQREIALAYYAYYLNSLNRNNKKRIYEIFCDGCCVELDVFEDFEQKNIHKLLHQKEALAREETEKYLAAKYVVSILKDYSSQKDAIIRTYKQLEEYEYGTEDTNNSEVEKLINCIYYQIDFKDDVSRVDLFGESIEIKREHYLQCLSEDIADAYVPLIQEMLDHISNNLNNDDTIYLYIRNFSTNSIIKEKIEKLARDHCVEIELLPYKRRFIARGNAYAYYLRTYVLKKRVKENIGRFSVSFENMSINLNLEKGSVDFTSCSDFDDSYCYLVYDEEEKINMPVDLLVPFSISGSIIRLEYSYEGDGLRILIEDQTSGESIQKSFNYSV